MNVYGLLLTKGDASLVAEWCRDQLRFYDAVVCLDGTADDSVADVLAAYPSVVRLAERDCDIQHKTDHGLRKIAHDEIVGRFGVSGWVMCCHPDEFCYHDPRKIAQRAEREGHDGVAWYSPHFYPHPSERADLAERLARPLAERFQHYHWNYLGTGSPWVEFRLYRLGPSVTWDDRTHGSTEPHGLSRIAPFQPIFRHYKITDLDTSRFEVHGASSYYRDRWQGLADRTGVAFTVASSDDLFVEGIPNYLSCDRYDGWFAQPWNMGDDYCPDAAWTAREPATISLTIDGDDDRQRIDKVWRDDRYGVRTARIAPATVLEIGAGIGEFARLALHAFPEVRVIACEANPERAALLAQNLSSFSAARAIPAAIVPQDVTEAVLNYSDGATPGAIVPALSVIRLWHNERLEDVDWLKLDASGQETALLEALAAAGLLERVGWITARTVFNGSERKRLSAITALANALGLTHYMHVHFSDRVEEAFVTAVPRTRRCANRQLSEIPIGSSVS